MRSAHEQRGDRHAGAPEDGCEVPLGGRAVDLDLVRPRARGRRTGSAARTGPTRSWTAGGARLEPEHRPRRLRARAGGPLPVLAAHVRRRDARRTASLRPRPHRRAAAPSGRRSRPGRRPAGSPEPRSHSVAGTTPMPTTTASQGSRRPSASSTSSTESPPWNTETVVDTAPARPPRGGVRRTSRRGRCRAPRPRARPAASTIVTSAPSDRAVAATSWPMNPAPTTTRCARRAQCRRAAARRPRRRAADERSRTRRCPRQPACA